MYRHVAKAAVAISQEEETNQSYWSIPELSQLFQELSTLQPTLTLQWANILILLNYQDRKWWTKLLQTQPKFIMSNQRSVNPP